MLDHRLHSRELTEFGSSGVSLQLFRTGASEPPDAFGVARIGGGGSIGRHEAVGWQVFAVLDGIVEVTAGVGETRILGPGEAVQFEPGESHESIALVESLVAITESKQRIPEED